MDSIYSHQYCIPAHRLSLRDMELSHYINSTGMQSPRLPEYSDPISLINPDCDLDEVLKSRTIGEAMQMLAPKLPGENPESAIVSYDFWTNLKILIYY